MSPGDSLDGLSATGRWAAEYGVYRSSRAVDSYTYQDSTAGDSVLVTYSGAVTPVSDVVNHDVAAGTMEVSGEFSAGYDPNDVVAGSASAGSSWQSVGQACQSREENSTGWIDGCYQIFKLSNDGDANYDYYTWSIGLTP